MNGFITTVFVPLVLLQMADGSEYAAVGDNYPTMSACMEQAEYAAKHMAMELGPDVKLVSAICEPMTSIDLAAFKRGNKEEVADHE